MSNFFWKGFSGDDRHSAITAIQRVVSEYGDIVDVRSFSDISLSLTIEIEEHKIDRLYDQLTRIIEVERTEKINSTSKKERTLYLNVTFTKGTGNLKIEVPSVPG